MAAPEKPAGFLLRMEPDLYRALRSRAFESRTSVNKLCNKILGSVVRPREFSAAPAAQALGDPLRRLTEEFGSSLVGLVLFGSEARRENTQASDRDLLVVLDKTSEICRDLYRRWDAVILDRKLTPHFVQIPSDAKDAGGLWYEVAVDGIVLRDPTGAVQNILRALRQEMAENRIRRRWSHGHPYWVKSHEKPVPRE